MSEEPPNGHKSLYPMTGMTTLQKARHALREARWWLTAQPSGNPLVEAYRPTIHIIDDILSEIDQTCKEQSRLQDIRDRQEVNGHE